MTVHETTKCTKIRCSCTSNKLFCTELCTCGTEDEPCNNLLLDGQSIDEDSFKSLIVDIYQILFYYISPAYINITLTIIDSPRNIMLSQR